MVLGIKYGHTSPNGKEATYVIADEFMHRFEKQNGSLACRELIGHDINKPENFKVAQESGVFKSICPRLVRDAVEIVALLINR